MQSEYYAPIFSMNEANDITFWEIPKCANNGHHVVL